MLVSSTPRLFNCTEHEKQARNSDSFCVKLNAGAFCYARDGPMHKGNAVQLRLAFSAAAVCAVLAAATFSGGHPTGSLSIASGRENEPIFARSVSTIMKPSIEKGGDSHDRLAAPL